MLSATWTTFVRLRRALGRILRSPTDAEGAECLRYLGSDAGLHQRQGLVHWLLIHHDFVTIR
jgi:hypothetical protein